MSLHALLVGIDAYLPNELAEGTSYPPLTGAVADVALLYDYLVRVAGVPDGQLRRLTASRGPDDLPAEAQEDWPTYDRLVEELRALGSRSAPGDQVLFYFAGHGGRVPAAIPGLKPDGLDESLVPLDIGDPRARYLRDLELSYLIQSLADRGLQVTVILDCCHSGGATRDASVRGVRFIDHTVRPAASAVAPFEELRRAWESRSRASRRDTALGSGWLPEPRGFVLLAACRAPEGAFELPFEGAPQGVFTHWLVDSLNRLGPSASCVRLHDRVLAKVHSQIEVQTPVLEGEGERPPFGGPASSVWSGVRVLEVNMTDGRVLLATGRAHGTAPGSVFAISALEDGQGGGLDAPIALAEVTGEIDGTICWARLTNLPRAGQTIEPGALAVQVSPGEARLRRGVRLLAGELPAGLVQDLSRLLATPGFLELREEGADFLVGGGLRRVEIRDPSGHPLLSLDGATPAEIVAGRLAHLAKFRNIQELDNPDPASWVTGGLELALDRLPGGWDDHRDRPISSEEIAPLNGNEVADGDWICLQVRNRTRRRLYFAVLDLQPGWSIQQVAPPSRFTDTLLLEAGAEMRLPLRTRGAGPLGRSRDVLKVFASGEPTDFRWLELPRPGEAPQTLKGLPRGPLEELFDQLAWSAPATRALQPRPGLGWTFWGVAQIELQVVPGAEDRNA